MTVLDGARRLARRFPVAADLGHAVASPAAERELWADYLRFRRQARFLRDHRPRAENPRLALVLVLNDSIYDVKLLSLLASGLRRHGWEAGVVVRSRAATWMRRYAAAIGVEHVLLYDEFTADAAAVRRCVADADAMLREDLTFAHVKQWTYRGAWIGPQLLSTISRRTMRGSPDLSDAATRNELAELLPATLVSVVRAERLVELHRPRLLLTVEANYATHGALVDVAVGHGADVIQVTQPWRDDALMCRRLTPSTRREHPSSVSAATLNLLAREPWGELQERELADEFASRYGGVYFLQSRNQPDVVAMTRPELVSSLGLDPEKPIAVVFSHVLWDANLFFGVDLFEDYGDWFVQTVRAAAANPNVNWLVKLHPANLWKRAHEGIGGEYAETILLDRLVGTLPAHVRLLLPDAPISSLSLFEAADYGVTVRGTPGMEMACFGKRVLTAGTGRYSGLGFTTDSATREEYLARLAELQGYPPLTGAEHDLARRHALAVFRRRPFRLSSIRTSFQAAQNRSPLNHNVHIVARSQSDLRAFGDLDRWAMWAQQTDAVDYIEE
jgi:hypothetical protein